MILSYFPIVQLSHANFLGSCKQKQKETFERNKIEEAVTSLIEAGRVTMLVFHLRLHLQSARRSRLARAMNLHFYKPMHIRTKPAKLL